MHLVSLKSRESRLVWLAVDYCFAGITRSVRVIVRVLTGAVEVPETVSIEEPGGVPGSRLATALFPPHADKPKAISSAAAHLLTLFLWVPRPNGDAKVKRARHIRTSIA
jgi:hypothetical protein